MRRRGFIVALASAACAAIWVNAAHGQWDGGRRRVGWLHYSPATDTTAQADDSAFRAAMEQRGWRIGRNLEIDYHWEVSDPERARAAAAEVLNGKPDAIICAGTSAVRAVRQVTNKVPIVFTIVTDPVGQGIVQSLAHPGGNITGFAYEEPSIGGKWVELLKAIAPDVTHLAFVFNPAVSPYSRLYYQSIEVAARTFAVEAALAPVHAIDDLESVIRTLGSEPGGGFIANPDSFIFPNRKSIIEFAAHYRVPAIYGLLSTAAEGGLIYYSVDSAYQYQQAAGYVDKILHGMKPDELPVQQPTKFSLTINAKTAKALGLKVPSALLIAADQVFE